MQLFIWYPSFRLVHANLGVRFTSHGNEQFPHFRHEQTGSGAGGRGIACNPVVVIGISMLENLQKPHLGQHVNPAFASVIEQIVRVARKFGGRYLFATLGIKNQQPRWHPGTHNQAVMSFV